MSVNIHGKGNINLKGDSAITGSAPSISMNSGGGGAGALLSMVGSLMSMGGGGGSGGNNANLMMSSNGVAMAASNSTGGNTATLVASGNGITLVAGNSSINATANSLTITGGSAVINATANGIAISGNTIFLTLPQAMVANAAANLATQDFATATATTVAAAAVAAIDMSSKLNVTGGAISGALSIGGAGTSGKLYVSGTTGAVAGAYGYLDGTGVPGTNTSPSMAYSIFADNRIGTGSEFNAHSDRRLKKDISPIPANIAIDFIKKVDPVFFHWKEGDDKGLKLGFIAQDVLRANFPHLINPVADEKMEEEVDADGLVSPQGAVLQLSYDSIIPILASALREALSRITELERTVKKLNATSPI